MQTLQNQPFARGDSKKRENETNLGPKTVNLRKHITDLCDQKVLEELKDASDCFASPVHIVLENRFVASKNCVIEKSRFTADMRSINAALPTSSFPIPNCDSFRRECSQKGYRIYSNVDAASIPIGSGYSKKKLWRLCTQQDLHLPLDGSRLLSESSNSAINLDPER